MGKNNKGGKQQYSAIVFAILLIPSIAITFFLLSTFSLTGIPFLLLLILGSSWFTIFGTSIISIYNKGTFLWGDIDHSWSTQLIVDILLLALMGLIFLGTQAIPSKVLQDARHNLAKSILFGFIISTISCIPFVLLFWIVLQFYT